MDEFGVDLAGRGGDKGVGEGDGVRGLEPAGGKRQGCVGKNYGERLAAQNGDDILGLGRAVIPVGDGVNFREAGEAQE